MWQSISNSWCKVFGDDWVLDKTQGDQGKEQGTCAWGQGQEICKRN